MEKSGRGASTPIYSYPRMEKSRWGASTPISSHPRMEKSRWGASTPISSHPRMEKSRWAACRQLYAMQMIWLPKGGSGQRFNNLYAIALTWRGLTTLGTTIVRDHSTGLGCRRVGGGGWDGRHVA